MMDMISHFNGWQEELECVSKCFQGCDLRDKVGIG